MDRIPSLMRCLFPLLTCLVLSFPALATISESHGYAQFGVLKYPATFTHFDWVNPEAPKGGLLKLMAFGTFDTLNPYTFKGTSPSATPDFLEYGISELNEPLMVGTGFYDPSGDEPASSYGLIAESIEYSENPSWVVFNLRKQARFHDGQPITAYDVAFSYRLLIRDGHPRYRTNLEGVKRIDILSRHRIRFVFEQPNTLLIQRIGELPVLPQHYWKGRDFKATTFDPPLGSGPYRLVEVLPGRKLVFERVKDWWGKDLRSIAASTTSTASMWSSTATTRWRSKRSRSASSISSSNIRPRTGPTGTSSRHWRAARSSGRNTSPDSQQHPGAVYE